MDSPKDVVVSATDGIPSGNAEEGLVDTSLSFSEVDSDLLGPTQSAEVNREVETLRREVPETNMQIPSSEETSGVSETVVSRPRGRSLSGTDDREGAAGGPRGFENVNEFLLRLQQSNLLDDRQLRRAYHIADDARELAKKLIAEDLLTRYQAARLIAGQGGFFLGKYKILALLCRTDSGGIFVAEHQTMRRRVAIKTLSESVNKDRSAYERFLGGAQATGNLEHPNVVRVYCFDLIDDRAYLVMEHVEGRNLEKIVRIHHPLPWKVAVDLIRQVAEALEYAHDKGVLHLRLRPSHVMLTPQKTVKLLGLGMAGPEAAGGDWSEEEIDYLAPEQAWGTGVDHRADVFSLGCLLYFLLTKKAPVPPKPLQYLRDDIPEKVIQICNKMMLRKPRQRYQSVGEVAWALRCLLASGSA